MRSSVTEAACCVTLRGIWRSLRVTYGVCTLSTLRRFDNKYSRRVKTGPLIPCERRLAIMEIQENQEVTLEAVFEYRDYDRPFLDILVTLPRFD